MNRLVLHSGQLELKLAVEAFRYLYLPFYSAASEL